MAETEKTVTLKESELNSIVAMNKKLMERFSREENPTQKQKETKERLVTVFFIADKPVIGYANRGTENRPKYIYEKRDPMDDKNILAYVDVIVEGREKPISLDYNEFMRECDRKECKVVKVEEKEWTINQGNTFGRSYMEGTYHMIEGVLVPVEVKGMTRIFTVEIPEGGEATIHERYININK